jgi:predicted nucleic acid-binding protein
MAYLLATNVLSELRKGHRCDAMVRRWAEASLGRRHAISVLSLGEIRRGIELVRPRDPAQADTLDRWLDQLRNDYEREVLLITEGIIDRWGRLAAIRSLPVIDALIAATALEHQLTVVTRNVADFATLAVPTVNPFQ